MASRTFDPCLGSPSFGRGVVSPFATTPHHGVSAQEALKHVLEHVLCLPSHSGLRLSLTAEGYVKIGQVISMSASTIKALSYTSHVEGKVTSSTCLLICEVETLQALQGFAWFKQACLGHTLTPDFWITVTEDEFDMYQGSSYHRNFISTHMSGAGNPLSMSASTTRPHQGTHQPGTRPLRTPDLCQIHTVHASYLDSFLGSNMGNTLLYPDSNMGSNHDGVDHPDTHDKVEDLLEDPLEVVEDLPVIEDTPEVEVLDR